VRAGRSPGREDDAGERGPDSELHTHLRFDLELREDVEQHGHEDDAAPHPEEAGDEPRDQPGRQEGSGQRENQQRDFVLQGALLRGARARGWRENGAAHKRRKPTGPPGLR